MYEFIQGISPDFVVENEEKAIIDFGLAAIAYPMPALFNLFDEDRAKRIEEKIYKNLNNQDHVKEVNKYRKAWNDQLLVSLAGGDPHSRDLTTAIEKRLVTKWLGKNTKKLTVKFDGKDSGEFSPILLMSIAEVITEYAGVFKRAQDSFKIAK